MERHWSIAELARRSGVSADLIGRAETGHQSTKVEALRAVLAALGLRLTAIPLA
jgi:transcriptional regulator with XRE-family HTH domain